MELFEYAMQDTSCVPSTFERVVRIVLTSMGYFWQTAGHWYFLDLQNPESDIALIKGVPGAVAGVVGCIITLDAKAQPVEWWQLYRSHTL